jgi:predicted 3-demethylubiquinone-9 3-methyltransferase (glyoxalase superfamily)
MKNPIFPCLWFDRNAKEAAEFYCKTFTHSLITTDTPLVVNFESYGQKFMCLNGGPEFSFNPSISFNIACESEEEVDKMWHDLSNGGSILMPLDKYDESDKYGWLKDRFGVSWQLSLGSLKHVSQKITPVLMFTEKRCGQAEQAVKFYTSVFENSTVTDILKYSKDDSEVEGTVRQAQFKLGKHRFMAMDSSLQQGFSFNESISFVVDCKTQHEIDYYWNKLTQDGEEVQCGWLKDKFGVSWQIVPVILGTLMSDPSKSERVVNAFLQMKKFDIEKLINA